MIDASENWQGIRRRLWPALAAAVCLVVLGLAWRLEPAAAGYGTHEQMGMAPCGFKERTGYPCISCGMTTAFAYMVRGNAVAAFKAQPAGALLAAAFMAVGVGGLYYAVSGRSYDRIVFFIERHFAGIVFSIIGILLAGWGIVVISYSL